jgi:glycosyltransferase involved in cell wall biosynthesis
MTFSVIIPAYNRATLIGATLEAIFAQTLPPAEVIVVDDGSTDNTAEVARRWNLCRVIEARNGGAAGARHAGVLASRGERIAFCDSDDLWRPGHLAALAAAFALAPQAGFAFTNFVHVVDDQWDGRDKFAAAPAAFWRPFRELSPAVLLADRPVFEELLTFQPVFPSCTAMTRAFYDRAGGYDAAFGRLPSEDLEFTLRCAMHAPIAAVREPTVGVRKHPGNHSGNQLAQLCGEIEILQSMRRRPGIDAGRQAALREQIVKRTGEAFEAAFAKGDWPLIRRLAHELPRGEGSLKRRLKRLIASAPAGMADGLRRLVLR